MSKYSLVRNLEREINQLNRTIDLKIFKGEPYRREALRHKLLWLRLSRIRQESRGTFFRAFSFF